MSCAVARAPVSACVCQYCASVRQGPQGAPSYRQPPCRDPSCLTRRASQGCASCLQQPAGPCTGLEWHRQQMLPASVGRQQLPVWPPAPPSVHSLGCLWHGHPVKTRGAHPCATRAAEFMGFENQLDALWLAKDSDRIWRGSYGGKAWRHVVSTNCHLPIPEAGTQSSERALAVRLGLCSQLERAADAALLTASAAGRLTITDAAVGTPSCSVCWSSVVQSVVQLAARCPVRVVDILLGN